MTYGEYTKIKARVAKLNYDLDEMWENAETTEQREECLKLEAEVEALQSQTAEYDNFYKAVEMADEAEVQDMKVHEAAKALTEILTGNFDESDYKGMIAAGEKLLGPEAVKEVKAARTPMQAKKTAEPVAEIEGFKLGQKAGWFPKKGEPFTGTIDKLTRCFASVVNEAGTSMRIAYRLLTPVME